MHFKLTHQLPEKCIVACSGGPDSIAALHWLHRSHKVAEIIHINHNTGEFANESQALVIARASSLSIPATLYQLDPVPAGRNKEEWWRDRRYELFESHPAGLPIVLAHQLDDCVEEYVTCALVRGYHGTIPYRHANCIRPFRTCRKYDMRTYCMNNGYRFVDDPTNNQTTFRRGLLRQKLVPWIQDNLNPGIESMVRRMIEDGLGDNDVQERRRQLTDRWSTGFTAAIEPEDPGRSD